MHTIHRFVCVVFIFIFCCCYCVYVRTGSGRSVADPHTNITSICLFRDFSLVLFCRCVCVCVYLLHLAPDSTRIRLFHIMRCIRDKCNLSDCVVHIRSFSLHSCSFRLCVTIFGCSLFSFVDTCFGHGNQSHIRNSSKKKMKNTTQMQRERKFVCLSLSRLLCLFCAESADR